MMLSWEVIDMLWICQVCGYEMESDEVPEICPVCSADSDKFEEA
jgi:rubrerythrin